MQRDRTAIRYEDFVKRTRPRRLPWIMAGVIALGALAVLAYVYFGPRLETHTPPPALSTAGGPVANETYQWRPVAVGGGGMISGMAMDPSGKTFVIRTDVYGAYVWDQKANRWDQLVNAAGMPALDRVQNGAAEGVYEIVVAPSRPDRLYMAINGHVYRSDDRGAHWVITGAGNPFPLTWDANSEFRLHGPFMAVDPTNPDLILLGTPGNGLWRSADAGATWGRVASVPASVDRDAASAGAQAPGTMLWYERGEGAKPTGRIFALSSGNGLYVSSDRGATFTPLVPRDAPQPMTLQRGVFDRHGGFFGVDNKTQSVWRFKNGQWTELTASAGLPARDYAAIASNPRTDQVVLFDRGGIGYQSANGGDSWSTFGHNADVGQGDPPWLRVANGAFFTTADVMFDPVVPNRLWVASGVGTYYADFPPNTPAVQWTSQVRGIEELVANDIVQPPGQSPIFAGWDFGMHVKDDLNAFSTTFGPNERTLMTVQQLDWTPAKPGYIITNATDARVGCCYRDGNAVMAGYSSDGGRKWSKFTSLPTPPGTTASDPWRMSFGTIAVSSSDADNIVWEPAYNRQPYYTTNRGWSWEPLQLPGASGDKPGSFEATYYQRKTVTADKTAPATFYFYHSGEAPNQALLGLWRSSDGAKTWVKVFAGEIAPSSNLAAKLRSVPGHAGHLFFTSDFPHTTDTGLRRSIDGGENWTIVPEVTRVDDIAFGKAAPGSDYPAIYISGRVGGVYGIWRSVDDAKSWQMLVDFPVGRLDQVTAIGADPDIFGRVYMGYKGSGWIWGEPAACKVAPYQSLTDHQCTMVR